jgi:thioredoxin-like negative regulator of GroEL
LQAEYGQVLGWAGETETAIAELSALPRASLPASAAVLLADLLLGREHFAAATELYRQALASTPEDHLTRFKLARVLSWQKLFGDALAEYRIMLAATPDDVQLRRHYARTLGWADQTDAAITEWRRTLSATP